MIGRVGPMRRRSVMGGRRGPARSGVPETPRLTPKKLSLVSPELNEGAMTDLVIPRRFLVSIGDCFGRPAPEDDG